MITRRKVLKKLIYFSGFMLLKPNLLLSELRKKSEEKAKEIVQKASSSGIEEKPNKVSETLSGSEIEIVDD